MAVFSLNPLDPTSGAQGLMTQEQIENQRKVAAAMAARASKTRPMTHWSQALAQGLDGVWAGLSAREANDASLKAQQHDAGLLSGDLGVAAPAATAAPVVMGGTTGAAPVAAGAVPPGVTPDIKTGIVQTASALGIDPVDLATTISYETGGTFDPTKRGPTTKWGQHRGLIQFGEPQAKEHGVDWTNPVGSQLGPNGAVASYLKKAGVQPGMGLLDIYSAINAGAPGLYNRSDAAAGGAPGTVRDKVEKQMQGHRAKAMALFAENAADLPAAGASPVAMDTGTQGFAIPGEDPAKLRADAEYYAQTNPEAARQLLARADAAESSAAPVAPQAAPMPMPTAQAQPAPPMNGNTFNAIQAGGLEPVFQSEGVSQPWMNTAIPPAASPAARVAQAMQSAPMPPPRPANLATPQADLPAPGAVPAIGQLPVPAQPDYTSMESGGAREFAVAEGQRRLGQPSAPIAGPPAGMPIAAASLPAAAPVAPPAPVERVAQAVAAAQGGAPAAAPSAPAASPAVSGVAAALQGVNPRVLAAATSPYASPQTKQVAQLILQQQLAAAKKADPLVVEKTQLEIAQAKKNLGKSDAPSSIQEYEYAKSQGETRSYSDWKQQQAKAGASSVNVGGGSDKQVFDTFSDNTKEARAAANGLIALREARGALQGGAFTGAGADTKLALQKAGAAFGLGDTSKIENTETFRAAIAPQVAAMLKSTVGSANISNSDREFAEKAAGGSITLDGGSINKLLDIMEKANMARLQLHNEQLDAVYPDPVGNKRERALFGVKIPEAPAPTAAPDRAALEAEARRRGLLK